MSDQLLSYTWPTNRLHDAVNILAQKSGLVSSPMATSPPPQQTDDKTLDLWFDDISFHAGLESVSVESTYSQLETMILNAGPAIIRINAASDQPCFLVILKRTWKRISIITPELTIIKITVDEVKENLCQHLEIPASQSIDKLLNKVKLSKNQQVAAKNGMLYEKLRSEIITGCWLINLSPGADFFKWLRHLRIPNHFFIMMICESIAQLLMILSWLTIGKMIIQLSYDMAIFALWSILLLSVIPFKLYSQWNQCQIALNTGLFFKQRLLFGAMHLKQDEVRTQGPGQFMGRVMESEAFESMALDGVFDIILFMINFCIALWLLFISCSGVITFVLVAWMTACLLFCWINYFATHNWIQHFRNMTNNIIERLTGYRTRIVQENKDHWHDDEDIELNEYQRLSEKKDQTSLILNPVLTRGWMLIAICCIILSEPESLEYMLISLGGIVIAYQSFNLLISGFSSFVTLLCSWQQVQPMFHSASRYRHNIPKQQSSDIENKESPLVEIHDISYQYSKKSDFKLHVSELTIFKGDRLLLEGLSGCGKSTLSSIISGNRISDTGIILLKGYHASQIGHLKWRRSIVLSPQFHENFIFTGSLAFNLLMGRSWPPKKEDLLEAEQLCFKLGLEELIQKMPEGFAQQLGENGWQLSHGEQSRLFIARALLQKPELIIFDESFMPLDSENFGKVLHCVLENDAALIIITHI